MYASFRPGSNSGGDETGVAGFWDVNGQKVFAADC
jgi:hypothetical protein